MTIYHWTKSGSIELVDRYGHGQAPRSNWAAKPAVIVEHDGDGHYTAWKFCGRMADAAAKLMSFAPRGCNHYRYDPAMRTVEQVSWTNPASEARVTP